MNGNRVKGVVGCTRLGGGKAVAALYVRWSYDWGEVREPVLPTESRASSRGIICLYRRSSLTRTHRSRGDLWPHDGELSSSNVSQSLAWSRQFFRCRNAGFIINAVKCWTNWQTNDLFAFYTRSTLLSRKKSVTTSVGVETWKCRIQKIANKKNSEKCVARGRNNSKAVNWQRKDLFR